jgi:HlyD family secretion protein
MTRGTVALVVLLLLATITVGAFHSRHNSSTPPLLTEPVTRGSIVSAVSATGTLDPVTTVQVGSQISGTIESLGADFNGIVHKGQVLARLDRALYAAALDQARSALLSAEAEAQQNRVAQSAADTTLARTRELAAKQLVPPADLQTDEAASRTAAAQVASADARVRQARAAVDTAEVNLSKTVILSPIDGVVIARNVEVGQTVSATMSAPTLFVLADDLSKMQIEASIDESDVGSVKEGQPVTFRVDAYPSRSFTGKVLQVRLDATTVSNVVTYTGIIEAPNAELLLKPGMTASVTIQTSRRDDVPRVSTAALRFRPDDTVLARFAENASTPSGQGNTIWVLDGTSIRPLSVTVGISDGVYSEIVSPSLPEGTLVVTRMSAPLSASAAPSAIGSPLLPARPASGARPAAR